MDFLTNIMIERQLSIQVSIEPVEMKSLIFFINGNLDSIIIYNMKNNDKSNIATSPCGCNSRPFRGSSVKYNNLLMILNMLFKKNGYADNKNCFKTEYFVCWKFCLPSVVIIAPEMAAVSHR